MSHIDSVSLSSSFASRYFSCCFKTKSREDQTFAVGLQTSDEPLLVSHARCSFQKRKPTPFVKPGTEDSVRVLQSANVGGRRFTKETSALVRQASNLAATVQKRSQRWTSTMTPDNWKPFKRLSKVPIADYKAEFSPSIGTASPMVSISEKGSRAPSTSRVSIIARDWDSVTKVHDPESPLGGVYVGEYDDDAVYSQPRKKVSAPAFSNQWCRTADSDNRRRTVSEYKKKKGSMQTSVAIELRNQGKNSPGMTSGRKLSMIDDEK